MKILLLLLLFVGCRKHQTAVSCNDCEGQSPDLTTRCSIYIDDESQVKWIYPEVTHKLHPGTYWIFDSIRMEGSKQYDRSYDLKKYLQLSKFSPGDSFFIRYEIRYRFKTVEWVQLDTLLY